MVTLLQQAQDKGDEIILYLDANEDLRTDGPFSQAMQTKGLGEVCILRHGPAGPSTYQCGCAPIDGIFTRPSLRLTRCGYLPFTDGLSNHRPIYLECATEILFGTIMPTASSFQGRQLQGHDPRVVDKYLVHYHAFLKRHDLYTRALHLKERSTFPMHPKYAKEFEAIDKLWVAGMFEVERKCRKVKTGKVAWSPRIQAALLLHRLWTIAVQRKQGHQISMQRILRLCRQTNTTIDGTLSLEDLIHKQEEAWTAYKVEKKKATLTRNKWLEDLAIAQAEAGLEPITKAIHVMKHRELSRQHHRTINRVTKPTARKGLHTVHTYNNTTKTTTAHTTKEAIEQTCLAENDARFRQSNDTIFQQPKLLEEYGQDGCTEAATRLLTTGQVPPEIADQDPFLKEYLQAHRVPDTDTVDPVILTKDHIKT